SREASSSSRWATTIAWWCTTSSTSYPRSWCRSSRCWRPTSDPACGRSCARSSVSPPAWDQEDRKRPRSALEQPDDVAGGVLELGQRHVGPRDLADRHD